MNFLTGFLIGVTSLIPGISGGTILVIMQKYEEVANLITHFKEKNNLLKLIIIFLGIVLGCITFARIIELLFYFFPTETLIIFSGFVLFSLPNMFKQEKNNFSFLFFCLGIIIMSSLSFISYNDNLVFNNYPTISLIFLILFMFCGMIDGFFTILPGISGSMIMMIIGPYFLYKSYLANLSLENIVFLIPLCFYFLGDLMGLFLGSKVSLWCLTKSRKKTMSLLLGMVLMSAILLLPKITLNFKNFIYYLIFLIISYIISQILACFT